MTSDDIPLHCNICPKKPNFSDVSHLLTHISSKGHLSNYYKVKVRSSAEDASRRLIDAYDRWYAEWGVEQLMSERMNQKDKRRPRPRQAARPSPAPKVEAHAPRPARRPAVATMLDPRLVEQQYIKVEPSDSPTPTYLPGPVLRQRPFNPHQHMPLWATESRASSHSYTNPDYETSSEYSDPSERKHSRYAVANSCAIKDDQADTVDSMAVSDSTKLKGVYWPGMDLFDSATLEMRRKRNQKKDSSVVQQLELNSQGVDPIEFIFTPQGSFKRQRRISDSDWDDDEEAEIKTESPRPARTRTALANMDANARRVHRNTQSMLSFAPNKQYEERGRSIFDAGHDNRAPKRKRNFNVFQDDDIEVSFSHPASMNYLTSGFAQQHSPTPLPSLPSYKPLNQAFLFENKENVLPSFHQGYGDHLHNFHGIGHYHHPFAYSSGQDQIGFQYTTQMYGNNSAYRPTQDDDDQRTITAPPSPSTS